ncbi:MAG TPA: hypothetical protein VFI23_11170 [Rhizomicrobium sp.]|nr:hypothetical protein [Rhizomicrobium sp.]
MRLPVFIAIGLAGIGMGLAQPAALSPKAQRAGIAAAMKRQGFSPSGEARIGNAITIAKFSSPSCRDVRVVPVSTLFQEAALLKASGAPGDRRTFVYMDRSWSDSASGPASASAGLLHLSQRFRQMARFQDNPARDTMLYVLSSRSCGPLRLDWSDFWKRA